MRSNSIGSRRNRFGVARFLEFAFRQFANRAVFTVTRQAAATDLPTPARRSPLFKEKAGVEKHTPADEARLRVEEHPSGGQAEIAGG